MLLIQVAAIFFQIWNAQDFQQSYLDVGERGMDGRTVIPRNTSVCVYIFNHSHTSTRNQSASLWCAEEIPGLLGSGFKIEASDSFDATEDGAYSLDRRLPPPLSLAYSPLPRILPRPRVHVRIY